MFIRKLQTAAWLMAAAPVLMGLSWLVDRPPEVRAAAALPALPTSFTRTQALIKPRADESQVERIPWKESLWEARLQAAAEGKPIFIWVTGGPPGGC